jgi:TPR repeat protein
MLARISVMLLGLAALVLALLPANAVAAGFTHAQKEIEQGHYSAAVQRLKPLAARGDARAEEALGALYDSGRGVLPDPVLAAKLYREAALQGSGAAQLNLANLYREGRGVAVSPVLAYAWADAAAASGEAGGQRIIDRLARVMPLGQLKQAQSLAQRYVDLYVSDLRTG